MHAALRLLAALPRRPGRFLLAPRLAGGSWLVGFGTPTVLREAGLEALPLLLEPGPKGTVLVLGYELGRSLMRREAKAREDLELPRALAIRIEAAVSIDPRTGVRTGDAELLGLMEAEPPPLPPPCDVRAGSSLSEARHREGVEAIREWIRAGDCYQANLTVRLDAPYDGAPEALLAALHRTGPQACTAYVDGPDDTAIVSASPELLLDFQAEGRLATSEPIKGTRPRGAILRRTIGSLQSSLPIRRSGPST